MSGDSPETFAEAFGLLSDQRRLFMLLTLRQRGEPMTVSALASDVATREVVSEDVPGELVDRVHISLRHVHVPKLVDAGVLEYDPDSDRVRLSEGADSIERVFDSLFGG